MAKVRSVDFLPEIFQTDVNKQFLAATLDQLIQEPKFKKTQGFIGRTVGPGVNPNEKYVIEPTQTRADYQLEPGIISLKPDTNTIQDAITYPGLLDSIAYQGGDATRPDRLFESEYYTWDPFIDWDTFINFSQYFWLPNGPNAVDVAATGVPASDNFVVDRANGVYTFSGLNGSNPTVDLVRGGSYTFQVAQNNKETVNYRVTNSSTSAYVVDFENNPTLTLARGNTYVFNLNLNGIYPFYIKTAATTGLNNVYSSGVTNNGAVTGLVTFVVPQDAPDTLFYASATQSNMRGQLNIIDGTAGTGAGFWIQAAPGISGVLPATPNISSRNVFGVTNNGEDLGTITFNVPIKTAQQFYYDLANIGSVDLLTSLRFDQINNIPVDEFIASYGGIDGITALDGRTLIFEGTSSDTTQGGWTKTTFFDPLQQNSALTGQPGSYDSLLYAQELEVPLAQRRSIWRINYITNAGYTTINLTSIANINNLEKFTILYGNQYASTGWFKNDAGEFKPVPLLTAILDTLYYQDATDPGIFGRIRLIEQAQGSTLFIDEIIDKKNYTSPNGIVFTNGLKVVFRGDVIPTSYIDKEYYISGVGTAIKLLPVTNFITPETYVNDNQSITVAETFVITTVPNPNGAGHIYAVDGVNRPVLNFIRGGVYTFDQSNVTNSNHPLRFKDSEQNLYTTGVVVTGTPGQAGAKVVITVADNAPDNLLYSCLVHGNGMGNNILVANLDVPTSLDYLTINRASGDLNAWSRSNRWFHIDVINATALYNNTDVDIDNQYRAKRPVIQFRPGIRLYNMGTDGKQPVNVIDFEETDAFSNIEGSTSCIIDGYSLVQGSRVIFASDEDANVANKIWVVNFVSPDSIAPVISQPIIQLTLADDGNVLLDQSTVCLNGTTIKGVTFWYDGVTWTEAQLKTQVQQAPLFNVYDANGESFGNNIIYPSTTFAGSKLFSYAVGDTGILDPILQFPLQYLNLNNVGDIVFENNLYKDTFLYVLDNVSTTLEISLGFPREYATRSVYDRLLGWNTAATPAQIRQQFQFTYEGRPLLLDVQAQSDGIVPAVKIYVSSKFKDPGTYTVATTANSSIITLDNTYAVGDVVEVLVLSDQTSQVAFYQVPINLENNPLNGNSDAFTLGTIRTHYESICENLITLTGTINGANNTRDLGQIGSYGLIILQQSSPLTLAGYFNRSKEYNIFSALRYNSREYQKFKDLLMNEVVNLTLYEETPAQILIQAMANITQGRLESNPFYWSDMLPSGAVYIENQYTVSLITTNVFDTVQVYNYTSANYLGMLVYKNNVLLTRGVDYVVATDGPRITILTPLAVGNVITIQEYSVTYGSFVPNTPTKLGLYPAFLPTLATVNTTNGNRVVIFGHDGSQTPIFGDVRDQVLLEFETRIYNNLKLDGNPVPINASDVISGQFRNTGYSTEEVNAILNVDFLSYVGANKLNYNTQNYTASNEFTWNYSGSQNKLTPGENLLGAWRGIYRYFYDTQDPANTPWEMVGFSIRPSWWNTVYGPGPYTADNMVLWDDLEAGIVADPMGSYVLPAYIRPGLTQVIPVDSEGNLISPFECVVGNYNETTFQKSWSAGDGGPVEASWYNSSAYPFAIMRLYALTVPAKFYSLFADRDLYRYQSEFGQYLYANRYRLNANNIQVYGDGVSKASFIDWIVDYNRTTGINSTDALEADLQSIDVRLCYRLASFSDKQYIKLYTEKSSPNSLNTTLQIPDESYDLLLYKNQPFDRLIYSSVVIQIVEGGYAVFGYSTTQPFFNILVSQAAGRLQPFTVGDITVRVPTAYTNTVSQVPYGYVFTNQTSVCDFLLSYGKLLNEQGLVFDDRVNGYELDWSQMVVEFLYWSQQGWENSCLINLNPLASALTITKPGAVVDSIVTQTSENVVLDQNKRELPTRNINIVRLENTLTLQPLTDQSLSFADLRFTNFEHMIVLKNQSVFGDLIYQPITGARQSRLNFVGVTSTEWNGTVDAQGFILNQDNVEEWSGGKKYTKGQIVKYKDQYWSAMVIVDPSLNFDFNKWIKSDYSQIELGLLPNIANKANQLQSSYSVNTANLENDNDLLSYGLIGFRPREYMAALNLDDVSQVNVYSQFLGTKGTILSAELLSNANLGKESADYQIYENWAVQRAVYGANANRSYVELRLNRAVLSANPSLVQVIQPQQQSQADQTIFLSNVWKQSYKLTSPDFLPTTLTEITDTALPSAGYVNLEDATITTFDLAARSTIVANLGLISAGATVWVAKVNNYDWNIYRCVNIAGFIDHVCDNLDGTSIVNFTKPHGLLVGDSLIIKQFDVRVDGVYRVLTVQGINRVTVAYTFTPGEQTVINGVGIGFTLQTQRVTQASDVINLPYTNDIQPGAKVWVDDDGTGHWQVLQKQNQFSDVIELAPELLDATEAYGQSVVQARNRFAALVGSPRYGFPIGNEKGAVYVYVKNYSDQYAPVSPVANGDAILTLDVDGVRGYGNAVDFGNQIWAVAGASKSLGPGSEVDVGYAAVIYRDPSLGEPGVIPYAQWQLLISPNNTESGLFGHSVAISTDERWLYVGAPAANKVYAYGRVDWQDQFVKVPADGSTISFDISATIQINEATQLFVTLDGTEQILGTDYTINASLTTVTFATTPEAGVIVDIHRYNNKNIDGGTYYDVTQTSTSGVGEGVEVTIRRIRNTVGQPTTTTGGVGVTTGGSGYAVSDTITFLPGQFEGGGTSPANNLVLTVDSVGDGGSVETFSIAYTPPSLLTTFSLNEYFFTINDIYSFSVYVDTVLYRPGIDYTFDAGTKNITFDAGSVPPAGAVIVVQAQSYFEYVDTLTVAGLAADAEFGYSVSTTVDGRQVLVGTPNKTVTQISTTSSSGLAVAGSASYSNISQSATSGVGTGAVFNITRANTVYFATVINTGVGYESGDTITINGNLLGGVDITNDLTITVTGVNSFDQAGCVYVFDRNVQRFIYGSDPSSVVFTTLGTVSNPVSVIVNNVFFINQTDSVINAPNSFSVSGNDITINSDLQSGDIIEIETNQFRLMQQVVKDTVTEFTEFGHAVDICSYSCSLYIGAPQDSTDGWKSGSVQRNVNQSRSYGSTISLNADAVITAGDTLRVNNQDIEILFPTATQTSLERLAQSISQTVPNVTASVSSDGYLTIAVANSAAAAPGNKLQVAPGSEGTAFDDIGFETFVYTQSIYSPYPVDFAGFGSSLNIDDTANNLVVGAPRGTLYLITLFDDDTTDFDENSTIFFSEVVQSGAVYTYDYLPSAYESATNPGKFVFGLQITDSNINTYDVYGASVSYVDGVLMVGASGSDATAADSSGSNYGRVFVFENANRTPAWTSIRTQQPVVDIRLLNSVFTYDIISSARTQQFDFFNPLQGKILGAARQNIDYIGAIDPAGYNVGPVNNTGMTWLAEHVGQVWWNISGVRFIDPNQDDIVYASRRWGQVFPGSTIDIYQWIQSTVPPATYTGEGIPLNVYSYTLNTRLGVDGTFNTYYYFWVKGLTTVASKQGKTLSPQTVANYIENPKASGIAYIAPVNASTVAIYNATTIIEADDTVISVEFDREYTDSNVHIEYELIAQGKEDAFLSTNLYRKLQDSFCGVDTAGNLVPDPTLNDAERYGVQFRPRQSMFVNRFVALKNYIDRTNNVLTLYPVVENRSFTLLNSSEPEPPSTASGITNWNLRVANLEILGFQDISVVAIGYKYLVASDSSNNGLWTIYTVQYGQGALLNTKALVLTRVQNYDTRRYWSYVNWYRVGYNSSTKVTAEVANYSALATITVPIGSSVKVTSNAQGKFEIYLLTDLGYERVGLQDGTIAISEEIYNYALGRFGFDVEVFDAQYFDQEPVIETRKIIQAINEELFIDELAIERNKALTLMFNFVLSEFSAPEWLVKTSLIDVDHNIRDLEPFQNFRQDNQEFVLDYIQEVKPYHVQIREFNLLYNGRDAYGGDVSDFDVPAYYNTSLVVPQYTSPILNIDDTTDPRYQQPYLHSTHQLDNTLSDTPPSSLVWQAWPYSQWINNYMLTLQSILKVSGGSGYTEAPTVTLDGDAVTPATLQAVLGPVNSSGTASVLNIVVIDAGSGYYATPTVVFSGGNGSGAQAYAVMGNDLVRSFKTIMKYDRYQYQTSILTWATDGTYEDGTLVRYNNQVWRAASTDSTAVVSPTFNLEDWELVPANELSGVDRTMGYYVPGVNAPGVDLPLLIDGIGYPGVQVYGDYFLGSNPNSTQLACTATTVDTNQITCTNTLGLQATAPIKFLGTTFGGIQQDVDYFVKDIVDQTHFTICTDVGGFALELTTATGSMQAISLQIIDATYASNFSDVYLGTRYSDINVDGGEFIGLYEGHAPEELVNGAEFDTLDMRVFTRPGSDWSLYDGVAGADGHGFQISSRRYIYSVGNTNYDWSGIVENPVQVIVSNATTGVNLITEIDYTLNWVAQTVEILSNAVAGDVINVSVFELGGGSQLYRQNYVGSNVGDELIVPVNSNEIYQVPVFVNGVFTVVTAWEPYYPGLQWNQLTAYNKLDVVFTSSPTTYYRALQYVIAGIDITNTLYWQEFVPGTLSKVQLPTTYTATDAINATVLGYTTPLQYSWSTPQTQTFVVTSAINSSKTVNLNNSLAGTNIPNMIVEIDGIRLRPYEGIEWIGDNSSTSFGLPQRGGYSQAVINPIIDITVFVDNVLQTQSFGAFTGDYSVSNYDGSNTPGRQVQFVTAPDYGARILISVSTAASYFVSGNQLQLVSPPPIGAILQVITFNDTAQQDILTQVYQGPVVGGAVIEEPYDSTAFDTGSVNDDPGSFDYSEGIPLLSNQFDLGRANVDASRLYVTLNGLRLFDGQDFTVQGQNVIFASGAIAPSDIAVIQEFTNSIVPEAMAFRVFQDMRGVQASYRITTATTTELVQTLSSTADIAYLMDASKLSQPELSNGVFGVCTVNGERIMYRNRDTALNTISGLMRGTAGTAAASHAVASPVYDIGRGNLLSEQYQDRIVQDDTLADGSTTIFLAPSIYLPIVDPNDSSTSYIDHSIEVYVGGTRQYPITEIATPSQYRYTIFTVAPEVAGQPYTIGVEFITDNDLYNPLLAPPAGANVTVTQRRGYFWYEHGIISPVTAAIAGESYFINALGNTDFTLIGAPENAVGILFVATGPGTGSGTITTVSDGVALQETQTQAARFLRGL